jgi:hypothetical protein
MTRFSGPTEVFEIRNRNDVLQLNQTWHDASSFPIV